MVSTWRFWSGKEINFSRSHPFQGIFLLAVVLYIMIRFSNVVLFSMALVYMFSGIWARAAYSWSRRRRRPADLAVSGADAAEEEPDSFNRPKFS
jgi:CDP-diacylglycerol--serine O-phosphatidyltransferase